MWPLEILNVVIKFLELKWNTVITDQSLSGVALMMSGGTSRSLPLVSPALVTRCLLGKQAGCKHDCLICFSSNSRHPAFPIYFVNGTLTNQWRCR